MKRETLVKRLNKQGMLTTKGKLIQWYKNEEYRLESLAKGDCIHPFYWTYNCGRNKLMGDATFERICHFITAFGCSVQHGNDAPRGGKSGEYICVSEKEMRKFKGWLKVYKSMVSDNLI
jgi:hypothetical protein